MMITSLCTRKQEHVGPSKHVGLLGSWYTLDSWVHGFIVYGIWCTLGSWYTHGTPTARALQSRAFLHYFKSS